MMTMDEQLERQVQRILEKRFSTLEAQKLSATVATKPLAILPDDLMIIADCSRSTAFELMKEPGFPPTRKHGRRQIADMAALIAFLLPAGEDAA